MYAWQFMKAISIQRARGWAQFVSMQNYYNLIYREEREMLPLCASEGVGSIPLVPAGPRPPGPPLARATPKPTAPEQTLSPRSCSKKRAPDIDKPVIDRVTRSPAKRPISHPPNPPWPGCSTNPPSPRPSSAPPNLIISKTPQPPSTWSLPRRNRPPRQPYQPHPLSDSLS